MCLPSGLLLVFFFKQKTAYEMRISDWSSDVCSSDLLHPVTAASSNLELECAPAEFPPRLHHERCGGNLRRMAGRRRQHRRDREALAGAAAAADRKSVV